MVSYICNPALRRLMKINNFEVLFQETLKKKKRKRNKKTKEEQEEIEGKERRKEKLKERRKGERDRLVNQIIKFIFTIIKVHFLDRRPGHRNRTSRNRSLTIVG